MVVSFFGSKTKVGVYVSAECILEQLSATWTTSFFGPCFSTEVGVQQGMCVGCTDHYIWLELGVMFLFVFF